MIDQLIRFGCPYHGLIKEGMIQLPHGAQMPSRQPAGRIISYPDFTTVQELHGSTFLQRMPWAEAGENTAADIEAGRNWTDYAILGGTDQRLHGQALNGWIYAGPDGNPWWVSPTMPGFSVGQSFSGELAVRRFGRIGGSLATHRVSIALTSTGQALTTLVANRFAVLHDITANGRKAIIALYLTDTTGDVAKFGAMHPIGFWLLTLNGTPGEDFTAELSVLRTDDQALGVADHFQIEPVRVSYDRYYVGRGEGGYVWLKGTVETPEQRGTEWRSLTGRIVGMWFDESETPYPVSMSMMETRYLDWTSEDQHTGGPLTGDPGLGEPLSGTALVRNSILDEYRNKSVSIDLTYKGLSARISASLNGHHHETSSWVLAPGSTNFEGESTSEIIRQAELTSPLGTEVIDGERGHAALGQPKFTDLQNARLMSSGLTLEAGSSGTTYHIGVVRHANNFFSLVFARVGGDGDTAWMLGEGLTPRGVAPPLRQMTTTMRHGSYNPATGQVERGLNKPVCWT